jgi:uracil-DNA glycosylase
LSKEKNNLIFILLGKFAQEKASLIDSKKHIILSTVHPSPLSANRGFFGSNIFKACNETLEKLNSGIIDWG